MRVVLAVLLSVSLSGCATSAAGLAGSDVKMTLASAKSAKDWAACSAESMIGPVDLRDDGTNYWIIRSNSFQIPTTRWDFKPSAAGSIAELRATINVNSGDERVRACA